MFNPYLTGLVPRRAYALSRLRCRAPRKNEFYTIGGRRWMRSTIDVIFFPARLLLQTYTRLRYVQSFTAGFPFRTLHFSYFSSQSTHSDSFDYPCNLSLPGAYRVSRYYLNTSASEYFVVCRVSLFPFVLQHYRNCKLSTRGGNKIKFHNC